MGSGSSKPEQHVFTPDAPVSFSHSLLDSLQRNPETDSTRAHALELKVQQRVREELTRLRDQQAQQLSSLTDSLTVSPPSETPSSEPGAPVRAVNSLAAHLSSPFYQDHSGPKPAAAAAPDASADSGRTSDRVKKEIMDLRKKLEDRKKVETMPKEVEAAKEKVVRCLRQNDRRPLDCWQEVEEFKREVGRLEEEFVKRVGR